MLCRRHMKLHRRQQTFTVLVELADHEQVVDHLDEIANQLDEKDESCIGWLEKWRPHEIKEMEVGRKMMKLTSWHNLICSFN